MRLLAYHDIVKEDIKEPPTPRNLSATARRVLQCTWPVAASRKYFSAILLDFSTYLLTQIYCLTGDTSNQTHITNTIFKYYATMHARSSIVSYVL